jgi:Tol biopolymer transport system component
MLIPDLPERLDLPLIAGVNPNRARNGSFSFTGDRLALAAGTVLMTGKVERDAALKIIGLSDLVVVLPDPGFTTSQGFTDTFDFSPDGTSIVASINDDLWMIDLNTDHTFLGAERLTENTDGFAEWNPSFSPDGSRIAYSAGPITDSGGVRDAEIYSLTLAPRSVLQVTTNRNKGKANSRNNAMWTADSAWIGFTGHTSKTPRGSPCSGLVNTEIFLIKADGSITATQITNTNGTKCRSPAQMGLVEPSNGLEPKHSPSDARAGRELSKRGYSAVKTVYGNGGMKE